MRRMLFRSFAVCGLAAGAARGAAATPQVPGAPPRTLERGAAWNSALLAPPAPHGLALARVPNPLGPALRLEPALLEGPGSGAAPGTASGNLTGSHRRYVLPVVLSALVPGAGEISTGHWLRGLPLVAADVATWLGYS